MPANHEYQSSGIFMNDDINIVKLTSENFLSAEKDPALSGTDVARYILKDV